MSEYKGIKGFQVQTRTEDPSPTEAQTGARDPTSRPSALDTSTAKV